MSKLTTAVLHVAMFILHTSVSAPDAQSGENVCALAELGEIVGVKCALEACCLLLAF